MRTPLVKTSLVRPIIITSPISGQPSRPNVREYVQDGHLVKEATWNDPASGVFIRKGIVSCELIEETK
jgi:hypothetical protein